MECPLITSSSLNEVNHVFLTIYSSLYNLTTMNFIKHTQHMGLSAASFLHLDFDDCCIAAIPTEEVFAILLAPGFPGLILGSDFILCIILRTY